jgi:ubiquinone/menaquinone biosynthesis C-methylase UbiE
MTERSKETAKVYDAIASDYDAKKAGQYSERELDIFTGLLEPGARILSAGSGSGRDASYFAEKGFRPVGLDISKELLKIGREQHPQIPLVLADMRKVPFPDNSFDGIWAHESIHHLDRVDIIPTFNEFTRVLAEGGVLFVLTRRGEGNVRIKEEMSSGLEREYTLLEPSELGDMLNLSGFEKIQLETFNEKDKRENGRDLEWISAFYKKR